MATIDFTLSVESTDVQKMITSLALANGWNPEKKEKVEDSAKKYVITFIKNVHNNRVKQEAEAQAKIETLKKVEEESLSLS